MARARDIEDVLKRDDFRGGTPCPLDDQMAFEIGRATVETLLARQAGGDSRVCRVVVGRDARLTSPTLSAALIAGLYAAGTEARRVEVSDVGRCSTEMVYFAVGADASVSGGVMVTASHNPKDDNGFKIVKHGAEIANGNDLSDIADGVRNALTLHATQGRSWQTPPKPACRSLDVAADYAAKVIEVSGINKDRNASLRIVVEAGSGVGGEVFRKIARELPFLQVVYSHARPDGNYHVCLPNPLDPAYMRLLQDRVYDEQADLGVAFDGDADRAAIVDAHGWALSSSEIIALLVGRMVKQERRTANLEIMYNLSCSRLVPHQIRAHGVAPLMTPVGHGQIKRELPHHPRCLLAGEHSGHFFFPRFFRADSGMIAALMIIEEVMSRKENQEPDLHDTIAGWREKYFPFDETNFKMVGREGASRDELDRLRDDAVARVRQFGQSIGGTEVAQFDAPAVPIEPPIVKVEFTRDDHEGWFSIRPSGNEPLLRLAGEIVLNDSAIGLADGNRLRDELFRTLVDTIGANFRR
ncbi:MAG: hypothetical protein FJ276_20200 [Planctomycetes bacterium]|nr:hypothetical protein [Planctomycetota bacterium]